MAAGARQRGSPLWLEKISHRVSGWTRAHPLPVDVVLAAVFAPLGAWSISSLLTADSEPSVGGALATHMPWVIVVSAAVVAEHVALAFRRVRPLTSFTVVSAAVGLQLLFSIWWLLPSVLVFPLSLYSYSAYGRPPAPAASPLATVAGTVVVTVAGFSLTELSVTIRDLIVHSFVRLMPLLLAAWSLGMFRRVRLAYVAALEERAIRAEAEREERARRAVVDERTRIAREMHDVVAHALSAVISQAQGGRYAARADPARAAEVLTTIAEKGRHALADMRGLLEVLRTDVSDSDQEVSRPTLSELPELIDRVRAVGVPVDWHECGQSRSLSPAAELAVFRLVQESLTNAMKHGGERVRVAVRFRWSTEDLAVTVTDDGTGPGQAGGGQPGHGLAGMRERLAVVGGSLSAGPGEGSGFVVRARVPIVRDSVGTSATREGSA